MTIETEPARERLRPHILETEETGRLELNLEPAPETSLPAPRIATDPGLLSQLRRQVIGILLLGWIGIDACPIHRRGLCARYRPRRSGSAAVAAGCGGAAYWLVSELRGLWRLRSAERLRALIPSALSGELKSELDAAATILANDRLLAGRGPPLSGCRRALP